MPVLTMVLEGDSAWPDIATRRIIHVAEGAPPIQIAALPGGMLTGKPSIAIRIDLPNGQVVIAETSARLFCSAARAIMAKYPDLFEGD